MTGIAIGNEIDMLFFPYNAEQDPNTGEWDRMFESQDWADHLKQFIGNGVYPNPSSGLRVDSPHGSMVLSLRAGAAFIEGRTYYQKRDFDFAVNPAHLTLGRRDIVVIRHDIVARTMQPFYIAGIPSATPQVSQIVRTDDIFDLQLCTITVNPNAQNITQANILDTRLDNALCGIVTGIVSQVDTTALFNQYHTYLNEQIDFWNKTKGTWFADWEEWTDEQRQEFLRLGDEIKNLIKALETGSFDLINNNFDDWSVRRGCDKVTSFNDDGSITETIKVGALDFDLAVKNIVFGADGSIMETIVFSPWEHSEGVIAVRTTPFSISKHTVFEEDGSIREEIR